MVILEDLPLYYYGQVILEHLTLCYYGDIGQSRMHSVQYCYDNTKTKLICETISNVSSTIDIG